MQSGSTTTSSRKPAKTKPPAKPRASAKSPPTLHLKEKHATPMVDLTSLIATAAYLRAEQRGFEPGHELEDWLHAEKQVRLSLS